MSKFIVGVILMLVCADGFSQVDSIACMKFKTGKFVYLNDSLETIVVIRTEKKQEEKNEKTGEITKFKIRWTGNCEYELTQTWSNSKKKRKFNNSVSRIQVVKLYDEGYDYTCACKDGTNKLQGTIRRIKGNVF
jgi:hypothetical protein